MSIIETCALYEKYTLDNVCLPVMLDARSDKPM